MIWFFLLKTSIDFSCEEYYSSPGRDIVGYEVLVSKWMFYVQNRIKSICVALSMIIEWCKYTLKGTHFIYFTRLRWRKAKKWTAKSNGS